MHLRELMCLKFSNMGTLKFTTQLSFVFYIAVNDIFNNQQILKKRNHKIEEIHQSQQMG